MSNIASAFLWPVKAVWFVACLGVAFAWVLVLGAALFVQLLGLWSVFMSDTPWAGVLLFLLGGGGVALWSRLSEWFSDMVV